jgi:tetratricopeptide (TPR) repeat protein
MLSNGAGYDVLPKVMSARGSASSLTSDLVIDTALTQEGERVVATVEVSDTRREELLWAETFSGSASDTFGLQRQVARAIARYFLDTVGFVDWGPKHPDAYRLYLEIAQSQGSSDTGRRAEKLRTILDLDPAWGSGWFQLATALLPNLYLTRGSEAAREIGEAYDAVAEPGGDAHLALMADGYKALFLEGDLDRAERRFREWAYLTGDTFNYAKLMRLSGLFEEGYRVMRPLAENLPFALVVWDEYVLACISVGRYQEAREAIEHRESLVASDDRLPSAEAVFVLARLGERDSLESLWHSLEARARAAARDSEARGNLQAMAAWARFQVHSLDGEGHLERDRSLRHSAPPAETTTTASIRCRVTSIHRSSRRTCVRWFVVE